MLQTDKAHYHPVCGIKTACRVIHITCLSARIFVQLHNITREVDKLTGYFF